LRHSAIAFTLELSASPFNSVSACFIPFGGSSTRYVFLILGKLTVLSICNALLCLSFFGGTRD
jgi:hypothetical protein